MRGGRAVSLGPWAGDQESHDFGVYRRHSRQVVPSVMPRRRTVRALSASEARYVLRPPVAKDALELLPGSSVDARTRLSSVLAGARRACFGYQNR